MQKILVFGATGLVGSRLIELLKDFIFIASSHEQVDLLNFDQVRRYVVQNPVDAILYAAGFTNVDRAEKEGDLAYLLNARVVKIIADESKKLNTPFYYLSTDYVFNGKKRQAPYTEKDSPDPIANYAKSKYEGEINTLKASLKNCVIRLIMPYRAKFDKKKDLARLALEKLKKGERLLGIKDQNINPVFVDDLCVAIAKLLEKNAAGIYHVGAASYTTPLEFLRNIASSFNLNESLVQEINFEEFSKTRIAKRPQHSWLDTAKFRNEFGENILHKVIDGILEFKKQIDSL